MSAWLVNLRDDARSWTAGRSWLWRIPLLAYFAWLTLRYTANPGYWSLFSPLNFGIHELGHVLFSPFGQFISIAGGTIAQCLAPIIGGVMFLRQRDYYAIAVAFGWMGTNLYYVAWYMADAPFMRIPLASIGGGESYHDWEYMLVEVGLLSNAASLSWLVRIAACVCMIICVGGGAWLLLQMMRNREQKDLR